MPKEVQQCAVGHPLTISAYRRIPGFQELISTIAAMVFVMTPNRFVNRLLHDKRGLRRCVIGSALRAWSTTGNNKCGRVHEDLFPTNLYSFLHSSMNGHPLPNRYAMLTRGCFSCI